ncbi:MAG: hypothetical protein K6C30_07995 [Bacteroidaceae bacterium]|nr:hypothetical protein [Bacteroidaceae bacterium]
MKKRLIDKVQGAFQELGIELKEYQDFYEFEYKHFTFLLSLTEEDQSMAFLSPVTDPGFDNMEEHMLKAALDIVAEFHKDFDGDWNGGSPYFISPVYSLDAVKQVDSEWLEAELKEFEDAFVFLEINIRLLCDPSLWE